MKMPIYLDYMATTPVDLRVKSRMLEYLGMDGNFGNPASEHFYGKLAREAIYDARAQVANLINADSKEIIFTSGATEANNLAIKGAAKFYQRKGKHIVTLATEHKAVLDCCAYLETQGFEVTYLQPEASGLLDLNKLAQVLRADTVLVSIMYVNNEIGVIQDILHIGELIKSHGALFHVDAAQAAGKVPIDINKTKVDLMSFASHKVYGPKGIGALYIRHKPHIHLESQIHGGGQEQGLRSGTLPTHQIVGMGEAFRIAKEEMDLENKRIKILRDNLWLGIKDLPEVALNGDLIDRVPHNLNVSFGNINGEALFAKLNNLAVSASAACAVASVTPSHVLKALGLKNEFIQSSIRFSLGRFTTQEEIDYTVQLINDVVKELRR